MAYLGLVPSEHSSGATRRQGGITKAGNSAARRMLIEAALELSILGAHQPGATAAPGGSGEADPRHRVEGARERLCRRYRKLSRAGKITYSGHHRDRSRTGGLLPGRSPLNTFKPLTLDALRSIADITKRRSSPTTIYPKLSKVEARSRPGEPLASTISRIVSGRWPLDRGSSATHHRSGGIQPAHQSMINRRFDDRASCPAQSRPF